MHDRHAMSPDAGLEFTGQGGTVAQERSVGAAPVSLTSVVAIDSRGFIVQLFKCAKIPLCL